ncbi:MAG: Nramp family divalent metal transporter [Bacteroidales bacterium]|nr:Nramp family divalent metal transporter [Bacteroidales bacterium]
MQQNKISIPPRGLAILAIVGPSIVWAAEYIGSGEVILATRTGAILGTSVIWAVVVGMFLKYWIGMSGARYTVCTGEGMIDMFDRMPGPAHWSVWIVLIGQFAAGAISIASVASAAGVFLSSLIPGLPSFISGWLITIFCISVVWSGKFQWLKIFMSIFVLITVIGVFYVAGQVIPHAGDFFEGLLPGDSVVPEWALGQGVHENPWREILPLIGWGAGGFASQVWYTYWVLGAGYGAAKNRNYGEPADTSYLKKMPKVDAKRIKGWVRVVYTDATLGLFIGVFVTLGFLIAGAGVLRPQELAPQGPKVAITLSEIFSSRWGVLGGFVFLLGGTAALIATQVGQMAGWPRLLADAVRICIPSFKRKFTWKVQFRIFLGFFLFTNMIIVYTLGLKPVALVKLGAVLDGLILTPLQALLVGIGLFFVMPKLLSKEARPILKPHWIFAVGLTIALLVFGYFCIFQISYII